MIRPNSHSGINGRNPCGTNFAWPSSATSIYSDTSVPIARAYFAGSVASSICLQVPFRYSEDLESLADSTIFFPRWFMSGP